MVMDARPLLRDEQHGVGSWHPAMRPNAHESGHTKDESTVEALPGPTGSENTPEQGFQSIKLPFIPGSGSQEQPLSNFSPKIDLRQSDDAVHISKDTLSHGVEGSEKPTESYGDGEALNDAVDADPRLTDAHELPQLIGGSADEVIQEKAQRTSSIHDDVHRAPAITAAGPSLVEGALGEREDMDRVWEGEQQNAASDTVAGLSRTNSFPAVQPLPQSKSIPPHSLPLSQAEDIIEEEDTVEPLDYGVISNAFPPTELDVDPLIDPFDSIPKDENDDYFANIQGHQAPVAMSIREANEESRYEEGLPLMQSSLHGLSTSVEDQIEDTETEAADRPDNDEFLNNTAANLSEDTSSFEPPSLDRKSTNQVLDSMHYAPHSVTHTESQPIDERPSLADVTGGGIAVSARTVVSQVLSDQQIDDSNSKPRDDELAEMWKAALGDDDLLEEDENPVDPPAFFEDDGEGFLEGTQNQAEEHQSESSTSPTVLEPIYGPDGKMRGFGDTNSRPTGPQNKYLPITGSQPAPFQQLPQGSSSLSHSVSAPLGFSDAARQPPYVSPAPSRPQMPSSSQSFADKSKGGYTSPYDLPMDVTRPKKRSNFQQMNPSPDVQPASSRPPPPRSSSMFMGVPPLAKAQPPVPRLPNVISSITNGNAVPPSLKTSPSMGSFFEELKPSSRSRPSSSMGRFVPPANHPTPPPAISSQQEPLRQSSLPQPPMSKITENAQPYQLLPPERLSLYGNGPQAETSSHTVPAVNARYSPAPPQKSNVLPPSNRYAASPSAGSRPPPSQALPFQPRTSSPLAQSNSLPPYHQQETMSDPSLGWPQSSGRQDTFAQESAIPSFPFRSNQSPQDIDSSVSRSGSIGRIANLSQLRQSPSPPAARQNAPLGNTGPDLVQAMDNYPPANPVTDGQTPFQRSGETSSYAPAVPSHGQLRRSQTSSPGAGKYMPEVVAAPIPHQRPASVNQQMSTSSAETQLPYSNQGRPLGNGYSNNTNYIRPTDGRELDPLERWKGSPIFSFGFGGAIVTSFPAQVPRYAAGQATPMINCSPGEIKLQDGKILPLEEDVAVFPGPLKSRSKKKDVLDWLQNRVNKMEQNVEAFATSANLPDPGKRHEEKIILWKVVRVLVEHDGVAENSHLAEKAIRSILSPELIQGNVTSLPYQASNTSLLGITRHSGSRVISDPTSLEAMEGLRRMLLHGEREKAVWHAVDHRLWAHAMLLSSTLDKSVWSQVSQEFVHQEVKTFGDNTEALAALYQIFAGNGDDSADELVPPSARAGLQMVSKTAGTGPTKNALDGLDRWRETLTLILSNRSPEDGNALVNLGRLLANYGRIEAAHTCYIFAKSPGIFGGPDDPQVNVVLLGADHNQQPFDYGRDLDSILLTEVYDFSRTVLASSSAATVSPHLQSFKLYHAMILAEYGYKSEAQQYCEVITSTLNSTTKRSPYYHNLLLGALDNLVERLRQAPKDGSGSWISKPSIDKVSGSLWAKFNQYVAGDESDGASTGSGKLRDPAAGPFAGVAGDSPTLSRTPSSSDLYGSYAPGVGINPAASMANPSNARYAPAGMYTPRPSLEQQGRPTQDFQRLAQADTLRPTFSQQQYQSRPTSSTSSQQEPYKPAPTSAYPVRSESYLPTPPSQPQYMPEPPPEEHSSSLYQQESYQPIPPLEPRASQDNYRYTTNHEPTGGYQPPSSSYILTSSAEETPSTNGYDPTSSSVYDPPSNNSEIPQTENSFNELEEMPKKKSFIGDDDDDDDVGARVAALKKEEKARRDREADEAFRRAAETDGNSLYPNCSSYR